MQPWLPCSHLQHIALRRTRDRPFRHPLLRLRVGPAGPARFFGPLRHAGFPASFCGSESPPGSDQTGLTRRGRRLLTTGTRNRAGGYRLGAACTRQLDQTEPAWCPGPSSRFSVPGTPGHCQPRIGNH